MILFDELQLVASVSQKSNQDKSSKQSHESSMEQTRYN